MSGGLIQILIIVFLLSLSGIGWLARKLQEQAELKRQRETRKRIEEEILRTGRDPREQDRSRALTPEQRRMREIAARRQAQLEELRRRRTARQQQPTQRTQTGGRTPPVVMGPGAPTATPPRPAGAGRQPGWTGVDVPPPITRPGQQQRGPAQTQPQQRPAARSRSARSQSAGAPPLIDRSAQRRSEQQRRPEPTRPDPRKGLGAIADAPEIQSVEELLKKTPGETQRAQAASTSRLLPRSRADLRRAVVMMEVLGPPLSERIHPGPFGSVV